MDDDLSFEYGEGTDAHYGCGATLMGEMWYFGGSSQTKQVCILRIYVCILFIKGFILYNLFYINIFISGE